MTTKAIELDNITYFYPNSKEPVLTNVTLHVDYGEFVVIAGPSGGGKSTLCRIIAGLIPHLYGGKLSGKVYIDGLDIDVADVKSIIERVGIVFQNPENQIVNIVVEEELVFPLENLLYTRNEIKARLEEVVKKLDISHLRNRITYELSGGEAQRVVLGSALVVKPKILLLDEPLAHLDPPAVRNLLEFLHNLNKIEGKTIVVVEHRLSELLKYASRIVILDRRIIFDGHPREIFNKFDDIDVIYGIEVPTPTKLSKALGFNHPILSIEEAFDLLKTKNLITKARTFDEDSKINNVLNCQDKGIAISVQRLWHIYDNGVTALKDVNLDICKGDFVAIVGGNGSGKTTLIKHFNGLLKPTKGAVYVLGKDTSRHSVAELAKHVGTVLQNPLHYFFRDNVYDEVMFTAKNMGVRDAEERVNEILKKLGLLHLADRSPYEISAGEQRRVAIASVLVYNPEIIVLDEPTAGIDFKLKLDLSNILVDIWRSGRTIILTTHDMEFLTYVPVQKIIALDRGSVIAVGDPRSVFYKYLPENMAMFTPQLVRLIKGMGVHNSLKPLNIQELIS
ncbi:MAG: ABC transporter ATP-binding protein [Ignisphaera sp.]